MADINRIHVSPGIYGSVTVDMKAAANSLGVTKLALVGETPKGPAFQPYWVHSPKEYAVTFGGTNPKKFAGTNYPQYELPYIASEYLKKGTELCVVRTLGFSGYNAGPAWAITGEKSTDGGNGKKYVIAILRSRGSYKYRADYSKYESDNGCPCSSAYDSLTFDVGEKSKVTSCSEPVSYEMSSVTLEQYTSLSNNVSECSSNTFSTGTAEGFDAAYGNFGRFTIVCTKSNGEQVKLPVSLNKSDKDYIVKVLGVTNDDGDAPLFVETLYDVAWENLVVNEGFDKVSSGLTAYNVGYAADYGGLVPVNGILSKHTAELKKKDLGKRYLYSTEVANASPSGMTYIVFDYKTNTPKPLDISSGYTVSWETASDNTQQVGQGEVFKITDGNYAGYWRNDSLMSKPISELVQSPTFGGTQTYSVVSAVSGIDLYTTGECKEGYIYTVVQVNDNTGNKYYVYKSYDEEDIEKAYMEGKLSLTEAVVLEDYVRADVQTPSYSKFGSVVYNYEDGLYYKNEGEGQLLSGQTIHTATAFAAFASGAFIIEDAPSTAELVKLENGSEITINRHTNGSWNVSSGTEYKYREYPSQKSLIKKQVKIYHNENNRIVVDSIIEPVTCDLNDYKTQYRYSSTPWVVSNAKGDAKHIEVNKLFRFHTISDGKESVNEVKVSIENIRPDSGEFDVVVRNNLDGDSNVSVLERFVKCTMAPGKKNIAYQIGTIDGVYESKSKYITVEINDTTAAKNSVPAGFLGYPVPVYNGAAIGDTETDRKDRKNVQIAPITYNTVYDEDTAKRKQYFGISDRTGYDYDYFSFKGKMATLEDPGFVSNGFHLDSRLSKVSYMPFSDAPTITVDGVSGYIFDTVSANAKANSSNQSPIIASEDEMQGCIFEDIKLRKFTMVFAGGFDGWDIYRQQRTNTDDFSYNNYKGYINNTTGIGYSFDIHNDASTYGIEGRAITSDYYSTLAGVSLLKNPEEIDINLLATPGIDTVNNTKLVEEVFNILEDRADTFYIVTTPDKEAGASDYVDDIPEVDEAVSDFTDKEIYSDYAATYYPWVKIDDNGEYVWLPVTRDIVRNLAESDNTNTTMNFAPAGTTRGKVDAIRARKNLKNGESDALYEANINPVRTYAQEGVVVMGQKTLRQEDDLLNRIDVCRMVLRLRKLIAIGCLGLIFEPNDNSTVKAFRSIITSIMQTFVDNRAIEKWTMEIDDSQEARDRLELGATIILKPVRALEYITLNFIVTNNEVYFES